MKIIVILTVFLGYENILCANPQNPSVIHGEAQINVGTDRLDIETSHKTILNWESFSIANGETTRFIQPAIDSAVLNRVTGNELSQIMGQISANGRVYLVNPNGVVIGEQGRIDAAAFIATVLDIQNGEFLNGDTLTFSGDALGSIINLGRIETTSGPISLIAHRIENSGELISPGTVSLTSGHSLLLDPTGDALIYIHPNIKADGVDNAGRIEAFKTQIQADAAPTALAIGHGGIIEATKIENIGGEVYLSANKGLLKCSGSIDAPSGTVHLLGDAIYLLDEASIDVSGEFGGGTALIGGDYKGQNPSIPTSRLLYVDENVKVNANAISEGDGGKLIFWGDELNWFYGTANAKGGLKSGDGGFVEISSLGSFDPRGNVDTSAPNGKTGTLLFDPTDVTITIGANANITGGQLPAPPPMQPDPFTVTFTASPANINDTALLNALAVNNVIIDSSLGGGGAGSISLDSASLPSLSWSANTLTLTSGTSTITTNVGITTTGTAGLIISSPTNVAINGDLNLSGTGVHSISGGAIAANNPITISGNASVAFATTLTDFNMDGDLNILDSAAATFTLVRDFALQAGNTLTYSSSTTPFIIDAPVEHFYFGGVIISSDADVQLTGPFVDIRGGIAVNGNGDLTLGSTGDVIVSIDPIVMSGSGNLNLNLNGSFIATSSITTNGNFSISGATQILTSGVTLQGNTITGLSPTTNASFESSTFIANNSLNITPSSQLQVIADVTFNTPGAVTLSSGILKPTYAGTTSINTTASSLSIPIGIDATGVGESLTINANNGTVSIGGSSSITDALTINAGANIEFLDGVSIEAIGPINMVANQDILANGSGLIQTLTNVDMNLVTDNANPNPPNFGNGKFTFPPNFTLCTNSCGGGASKVLLFSAMKGESTYPSVINNEAVAPGVNEFVGFWYLTLPPPDPPLFQLVYKTSGGTAADAAVLQTIEVAVTEPISNPTQISQVVEGNLTTPSTPKPTASCKPPGVAIQSL